MFVTAAEFKRTDEKNNNRRERRGTEEERNEESERVRRERTGKIHYSFFNGFITLPE